MWQFHRKITRPFFARERVTDFGIFDANALITLRQMQARFDEGHAIDFQDICSRFTIDSACEFLLGASIHSLRDPLPRPGEDPSAVGSASNKFARAFADAQMSITTRGRIGVVWPLFETLKDRTEDDVKEIRGFIESIVRAAMKKRAEGVVSEQETSLLQHLLNVTQDMKLIIDETINIMLAGRDTTAGLLTFVTYCLAMHPDVLARLREEVLNTVGPTRAPTFDDVRGMKYLRAVLNETLRLFPSVPFNHRFCKVDTTVVTDDGQRLFVPANTRVILSSMLAQRHKPFWGEDAHLFDPTRFLDERVKHYVTPKPFVFIPFSAGPRICLGQQFAYHEASFFMIRLLQRYDRITLAPECQPADSRPPASWQYAQSGTPRKAVEQCVIQSHLTLFVQGGLWLRMGTSRNEV
ncbi:cytochrome P450 [Gautieria morchelliformis]|nr:cytochrome P450 [Gautieria morchelliformis]